MRNLLNKAWLVVLVIALLLGKGYTTTYAAEGESVITEDSQQENEESSETTDENEDEETPSKADIIISDVVYPSDSFVQGSSTTLGGTVSSEAKLTSVVVSISSLDGTMVYSSYTVNPDDYFYSIDANVTKGLQINNLSVGTYKYTITASNEDDVTKEVASKQFTVIEKADITIKDASYPPSKLAFGKSVTLKGTVSSKAVLTSVNMKIVSQDGKKSYYSYTVKPNKTSFAINSTVNQKLKFQSLPLGKFKYIITATNADGRTKEVVSRNFEVTGKKSTLKQSAKLSSTTIYKGKNSTLSGKITSNYKISTVTFEVLNTKYKTTVKPNKTSYTISNTVSKSLKFNQLPKGTYSVKITATDISGKTITKTLKLKVIRYDAITYKIKGIKQRTYSDCALASMATCEYNNETRGVGKLGKALINAKDPYLTMKKRNGNSTYGIWSNIGYTKTTSTSVTALYNALKKGPVIVHKQNGSRTHFSVVYAYTGSDNKLSLSNFKVYEVTNGKTMSMTAWLGKKTSSNINGPGRFDCMVIKK